MKRRRQGSESEELTEVERDEHMVTAHARFWRRSLTRAYSAIAMENPVLEAPVHRGMQQLDRSAFNQQLTLLAARLPATKTTQFMHKDAKESDWAPLLAIESCCWESKLTSALLSRDTASSCGYEVSALSTRIHQNSTGESYSEQATDVCPRCPKRRPGEAVS